MISQIVSCAKQGADFLKFDLSTFTAVLQKSFTRFLLLPEFVEIPYTGTVVGIPLPIAKEFHSSMAVLKHHDCSYGR